MISSLPSNQIPWRLHGTNGCRRKSTFFFWRATQDRVPTRLQSAIRNIQFCLVAPARWKSVYVWCDFSDFTRADIFPRVLQSSNSHLPHTKLSWFQKQAWEAVIRVTSWSIWRNINDVIFKDKTSQQQVCLARLASIRRNP